MGECSDGALDMEIVVEKPVENNIMYSCENAICVA